MRIIWDAMRSKRILLWICVASLAPCLASEWVSSLATITGSLRLRESIDRDLPVHRLRGGWSAPFGPAKLKMTKREQEAIQKLKEAMAVDLKAVSKSHPELLTDERLLRFLRSHDCNIERTSARMREMLAWRRAHGTDEIRARVVKHFRDDFWKMPCIPRREFFRKMYLANPSHYILKNGKPIFFLCLSVQMLVRGDGSDNFRLCIPLRHVYLEAWTHVAI
jgi:hypothetical protein